LLKTCLMAQVELPELTPEQTGAATVKTVSIN
jgi:hypothetical protein